MTVSTGAEIRQMIERLGPRGRNEELPLDVRAAVLAFTAAHRPGVSWKRLGESVGVSGTTVRRWYLADQRRRAETTASGSASMLVPVVIAEESREVQTGGLVLVSPRGFRLEGLSVSEAAEMMERFE